MYVLESLANRVHRREHSYDVLSVRIFSEEFDAYIIVSFVNATLVLSIGETVEEVTDSGFLGTTPTLSCSALGDEALVQVSFDELSIFHLSARPT